MQIYGFVFMPEHVHLLLSEPGTGTLAEALKYLKLYIEDSSFASKAKQDPKLLAGAIL